MQQVKMQLALLKRAWVNHPGSPPDLAAIGMPQVTRADIADTIEAMLWVIAGAEENPAEFRLGECTCALETAVTAASAQISSGFDGCPERYLQEFLSSLHRIQTELAGAITACGTPAKVVELATFRNRRANLSEYH